MGRRLTGPSWGARIGWGARWVSVMAQSLAWNVSGWLLRARRVTAVRDIVASGSSEVFGAQKVVVRHMGVVVGAAER